MSGFIAAVVILAGIGVVALLTRHRGPQQSEDWFRSRWGGTDGKGSDND